MTISIYKVTKMKTNEYIPFTYLIGWTAHNLYYYGSKYGKGANPSCLWTTYFTSSNKVQYIREQYGEPDVIQIRKTFKTSKECTAFEYGVLKRILSDLNPNKNIWINQNIGYGEFYKNCNVSEYLSYKAKERFSKMSKEELIEYGNNRKKLYTKEVREKISKKAKERFANKEFYQKYIERVNSDEVKKQRSEIRKAMFADPEKSKKYYEAIKSDEYREKKSKESKERWQDENFREKCKQSLKKYHSLPDTSFKMSENSRKSTGDRIFTRFLNELKDGILEYSFDECVKSFNKKYNHRHKDSYNVERQMNNYKKNIEKYS